MRGDVCGGWRRVCEGGVWRVEGECEFSTPTESLGTRLSVNENNDTLLYVHMCTCVCVSACVRACVRAYVRACVRVCVRACVHVLPIS